MPPECEADEMSIVGNGEHACRRRTL